MSFLIEALAASIAVAFTTSSTADRDQSSTNFGG
jgi:hypothetical protein